MAVDGMVSLPCLLPLDRFTKVEESRFSRLLLVIIPLLTSNIREALNPK